MKHIQVIDSHTGGEPTRIIVQGGPDLGRGPLAERLHIFEEKFDEIRSAVVNEPRGSDVLVGGLLCEPVDPNSAAGIIFFNNAGFLGMCGHGTIGLVETLKYMGKLDMGTHQLETPVGMVEVTLADDGFVSVQNVPAYRLLADVSVEVDGYGTVIGDVAWGGNWFFLVKNSEEELHVGRWRQLTEASLNIRDTLHEQGITGRDNAYIDHIELFGPPVDASNDSRNFVLCPGGAYDRSPCGTGTSAKLACLAADHKLAPGEIWRQESIIGSLFQCSYQVLDDSNDHPAIVPTLSGQAFISGEAKLILDSSDPFCMGIRN